MPPYAWFTSFAPADDPQVAVAVMIQKAPGTERGEIAGGALGGPIAKAVMEAVIDRERQDRPERFADDAERYRLDSRIATGGMGEVWRATDTRLGRTVAVKLLKAEYADDATFRSRFDVRGPARRRAPPPGRRRRLRLRRGEPPTARRHALPGDGAGRRPAALGADRARTGRWTPTRCAT